MTASEDVVVDHDPTTGAKLPRPAVAIAITIGPGAMEHTAWLRQRYADDDGRGYDRAALEAHAATAHLARLRR